MAHLCFLMQGTAIRCMHQIRHRLHALSLCESLGFIQDTTDPRHWLMSRQGGLTSGLSATRCWYVTLELNVCSSTSIAPHQSIILHIGDSIAGAGLL